VIGYNVYITGPGAINGVKIVSPVMSNISIPLLSALASQYIPAAFHAVSASGVYERILMALNSNQFTIQGCQQWCTTGYWVFGLLPTLPTVTNGNPFTFCPSCNQTVMFGSNIKLTFQSMAVNTITCGESTDVDVDQNTKATSRHGLMPLDFITIAAQDVSSWYSSSFVWNFDRNALASKGVTDLSKVSVRLWNAAATAWQIATPTATVDSTSNQVTVNSAQYGTYGIFYPANATSSSSSSSTGGSNPFSSAAISHAPSTMVLALLPILAFALLGFGVVKQ